MPHIGVMMERSLQDRNWRDAFASLLSRSVVAALGKRQAIPDISGDISSAKTAFSSWDNCFQASFCKWPVIALFIIAGLIIFSILWCVIRCCCCGLSCCCECCYCLKCCGECCGMCDPPRGRRNKYLDEPFVPANHDQAYRNQAPMDHDQAYRNQAPMDHDQPYRSQAPMNHGLEPVKPSVPQYAEFDSRHSNADALPAMPSWEGASSKKVLVEDDSVEMDTLKKPNPPQNSLNANAASMPHGNPSAPATSPRNKSPYGPPVIIPQSNGYMAPGYNNNNPAPNGMNQQGRNEYDNRGYGQTYPSAGMNNVMGVTTAGPLGRQAPHGDYNTGYDHGNMDQGYAQYPQSRSPQPYNDEYGRNPAPASYNNHQFQGVSVNNSYGNDRRAPGPQAGYGYGNPTMMDSAGAQAGYGYGNARVSPVPQASYGMPQPQPQRSPTQDHLAQQYAGEISLDDFAQPKPIGQYEAPVSPIQNNSGFDFNSGYSRPDSRAGQAPSGPPPMNTGPAYPGYRPYKP